jgi:hypothetical protein
MASDFLKRLMARAGAFADVHRSAVARRGGSRVKSAAFLDATEHGGTCGYGHNENRWLIDASSQG